MKLKITSFLLAVAFIAFTAFKPTSIKKADTYTVDVQKSQITWYGKKFGGSHTGTVALKSGTLTFNGKKLTNGGFIADMASIKDNDGNKGLEGHLKRDDFFGVEKFPTANFAIKKIAGTGNTLNITGDLTIKGVTHPITFPANITWNADGTVSAAVEKITIDRTKYGIQFKSKSIFSDIGNNFIYDEFEIGIKLTAKMNSTAK